MHTIGLIAFWLMPLAAFTAITATGLREYLHSSRGSHAREHLCVGIITLLVFGLGFIVPIWVEITRILSTAS